MLGLATLIIGPILATQLTSVPLQDRLAAARAHTAVDATIEVSNPSHFHLPLAIVVTTPTPVPTPLPTAVPTPQPTARPVVQPAVVIAPAATYAAGTVQADIVAAATTWGVSPTWMLSIARCESNFHPTSVNPSGPYEGLFQFLPSTFAANGGTDIWDPVQQSEVTAKMLAHGQAHQWSCA